MAQNKTGRPEIKIHWGKSPFYFVQQQHGKPYLLRSGRKKTRNPLFAMAVFINWLNLVTSLFSYQPAKRSIWPMQLKSF